MIEQATVLIVSDFPEITDNLRRYLLESEFTFRVLLESSSASLILCNQQQIDLILLDSSLPNSNGLDYLAKLRASYGDKCPSVIILGENDVAVAVKALKNGAEDYLVKQQLTEEGLIEAVRNAVTKKDIEQNQTTQAVYINELAELNQVEQALRENEKKLSFILNNVNLSISRFCVYANHDWRYDYYSSGCKTVFGYTSTELVADKNLWQSRVFPEDLENVIMPKFSDIFAELTIDYEYRFYHQDGSLRWIQATLTSQRDEIESVWYVTSVDSDITRQKEVEAALRESQLRFERLVANVPGMIYQYILHPDGKDAFTYVSPKSRDIYELEPSELNQSANVWAMIYPDDVAKVQEANKIASQHLEKFDVEFRLITPSGNLKWLHTKSQPELQDNGDVLFDGLVMDITERKRAELALQQSESLFRGIFESDLIGILFWNLEGQITDANNAFIKMTGYNREDLQAGKIYYSHITPKEYHQLDAEKFQLLSKGESYVPFEKEYICKDGKHLPIIIGCAFLPGFTDRGVAFILDISEQKQLRQEKEILLEKAETARTEAEVANHTKDEFIAIVSHELRSPLNSILGWAKLMQTRKLDEAAKLRALQTIERNAKAQAQLIEDLLDISRMIRGNLRLNLAPVTLINSNRSGGAPAFVDKREFGATIFREQLG
ncbi:PAS domain S-box protein, partial [Dulcicalothrix desertica]